jgi:hypothetical protein
MVCRHAAEPAVAKEIRPAVTDMGNMGRSVANQKQNRRRSHSVKFGITGVGQLVDLSIGPLECSSQQWSYRSGWWSLIQIAAKPVDG